jgi:hypothetical protein
MYESSPVFITREILPPGEVYSAPSIFLFFGLCITVEGKDMMVSFFNFDGCGDEAGFYFGVSKKLREQVVQFSPWYQKLPKYRCTLIPKVMENAKLWEFQKKLYRGATSF